MVTSCGSSQVGDRLVVRGKQTKLIYRLQSQENPQVWSTLKLDEEIGGRTCLFTLLKWPLTTLVEGPQPLKGVRNYIKGFRSLSCVCVLTQIIYPRQS